MEFRSGKKIISKCVRKCYLAVGSRCVCSCGGENHGKGLGGVRAYSGRDRKSKNIKQMGLF